MKITPMEDDIQWKTSSNGRWPPMEDNLQWKMTSHGGRPPIEDDLKLLKVEYFSNHWLDYTQMLNLSWDDQTIFYKSLKWRQPPMEDYLKILNVEYLRNQCKLWWPKHILQILKMNTTSKKDLKACRMWLMSS